MRKKLVELRGDKNQKLIAKRLDISQQYLSEIERGVKTPSIKLMKKFEREYKMGIFELFPDIFVESDTAKCS